MIGRRADGYHLLETVFRCIDRATDRDLRVRDDGAIARVSVVPGVPPDSDLAVRAARRSGRPAAGRLGVDIELESAMPLGGGLGGGSSDAATLLLALNRLWEWAWTASGADAIGVASGCRRSGLRVRAHACAAGIGERLTPVALPPRWYLRSESCRSRCRLRVFTDPELTRDTKPITISGFSVSARARRNDLQPCTARSRWWPR